MAAKLLYLAADYLAYLAGGARSLIAAARHLFASPTPDDAWTPPPPDLEWLDLRLAEEMWAAGRNVLIDTADMQWAASKLCQHLGCHVEVKHAGPSSFIFELTRDAPSGEVGAFAVAIAANAAHGTEVVVRMAGAGWEERRVAA